MFQIGVIFRTTVLEMMEIQQIIQYLTAFQMFQIGVILRTLVLEIMKI
jgi:hypothetical protein